MIISYKHSTAHDIIMRWPSAPAFLLLGGAVDREGLDGVGDGGDASAYFLLFLYPVVEAHHGGLDIDVVFSGGHEQVDVVAF